MSRHFKKMPFIALLLCLPTFSYAMPEGFEPVEEGKQLPPAAVEMKDLGYDMRFGDKNRPRSVKIKFSEQPERTLTLDFRDDPDCFYLTMVGVEDQNGKTLMPPTKLEGCSPSIIYSLDINGDGVPDYAIYTFSTACGSGVTDSQDFIVSVNGGYKYAGRVDSMSPEGRDFVKLRDGKTAMIFTSYIEDVEDIDGAALLNENDRNFWVYNLIRFDGDKIVSANKLDSRFPRWILGNPRWSRKIKANHEDTELLTGKQRCKWFPGGWRKEGRSGNFDGIEALCQEQMHVHNAKAWLRGNQFAVFSTLVAVDVSMISFLIVLFLRKRKAIAKSGICHKDDESTQIH